MPKRKTEEPTAPNPLTDHLPFKVAMRRVDQGDAVYAVTCRGRTYLFPNYATAYAYECRAHEFTGEFVEVLDWRTGFPA